MRISYSKAAIKFLQQREKRVVQRIREAVQRLPEGDIEPMQGAKDEFRLRVGGGRGVFKYEFQNGDRGIMVLTIGSRGDVYKK